MSCVDYQLRENFVRKIALFNNKGGVGKTTLAVNLAYALADAGKSVLMVDADPQCNLSAFCLDESELDELLAASESGVGKSTVWDGVRPVVLGRGDVELVTVYEIDERLLLLSGDVLVSNYEEELPVAWTDSFARKSRGYDVMCALSRLTDKLAAAHDVDVVIYDVGPNVGSLNRAVLLDCDFFVAPVGSDLFSLRALGAVGSSLSRWIKDWSTVTSLAMDSEKPRLLKGRPCFAGYITSAYKVRSGGATATPHRAWEAKIAPRVKAKIVDTLSAIDTSLALPAPHKIGDVKNFHSLAADAQHLKLPLGRLRGKVNPGHNDQIAVAQRTFVAIATTLIARLGI